MSPVSSNFRAALLRKYPVFQHILSNLPEGFHVRNLEASKDCALHPNSNFSAKEAFQWRDYQKREVFLGEAEGLDGPNAATPLQILNEAFPLQAADTSNETPNWVEQDAFPLEWLSEQEVRRYAPQIIHRLWRLLNISSISQWSSLLSSGLDAHPQLLSLAGESFSTQHWQILEDELRSLQLSADSSLYNTSEQRQDKLKQILSSWGSTRITYSQKFELCNHFRISMSTLSKLLAKVRVSGVFQSAQNIQQPAPQTKLERRRRQRANYHANKRKVLYSHRVLVQKALEDHNYLVGAELYDNLEKATNLLREQVHSLVFSALDAWERKNITNEQREVAQRVYHQFLTSLPQSSSQNLKVLLQDALQESGKAATPRQVMILLRWLRKRHRQSTTSKKRNSNVSTELTDSSQRSSHASRIQTNRRAPTSQQIASAMSIYKQHMTPSDNSGLHSRKSMFDEMQKETLLPRRALYNLARQFAHKRSGMSRTTVTPEQRQIVLREVQNHEEHSNPTELYSKLHELTGLSRITLHRMVYHVRNQQKERPLTDEERDAIVDAIQEHWDKEGASSDTPLQRDFYDNLQEKFQISRTQIYSLVQRARNLRRKTDASLPRASLETLVQVHLDEMRKHQWTSREFYDQLEQATNLPRASLYALTTSARSKVQRQDISMQQRQQVRQEVWRYLDENPDASSLSTTLYDSLETATGLPRAQLYDLTRTYRREWKQKS